MNIDVRSTNMTFLEAFASETRVKMIELLNDKPMNIKDIAAQLGISSAIVTKHIKKLEDAGIIESKSAAGKRGTQKVCSLRIKHATLQFQTTKPKSQVHSSSIPVGQYSSYRVQPTCGLCSDTNVIGMVDDPRYFADPEHVHARHIWFAKGWVEYQLPNYLHSGQRVEHLEISMEICSEAPESNENWPSDITFYINETAVGTWTCPGDFGKEKGIYTPDWWIPERFTQYGLLKTLHIYPTGTYMDGVKISDVTIQHINITANENIYFRIESKHPSDFGGGVSLFGKGFGNYDRDIEVNMYYESK